MGQEHAYTVIDLHCDMLHYLATEAEAAPEKTEDIGCAVPYLKQGKVGLQVMAISCVEKEPDPAITERQIDWYRKLAGEFADTFTSVSKVDEIARVRRSGKVAMVPAIENASALAAESDTLDKALAMLDRIIAELGKPFYISLTHHGENRYGGGNMSEAGLKDDGRALLEYISGKKISVDLSHTSDALAQGILEVIDNRGLDVPVIASHSNFRRIHDHRRNLPDELAQQVIKRMGLIGINFLRAFMHPSDPGYLKKHIEHGLKLGGEDVICLGADYFSTATHPDPSRRPFYFTEHEHAGKYQDVLNHLADSLGGETAEKIAYSNVVHFCNRFRMSG